MMKVLVAGFGNILRGDDGFGVMVSRALIAQKDTLRDVKIIEVGILGITLVQELLDGYDGLIVLDTVDRGGDPGTLYFFEPEVEDLESIQRREVYECMADIHQTDPSKALLLARALGVLPRKILIIGCQPQCCDDLGAELSEPVQRAVGKVLEGFDEQVRGLRDQLSSEEMRIIPKGHDAGES
jgi:hydrogenase maturation protease